MDRNLSRSWMAGAAFALVSVLSALPAGAGYSSWTSQGPYGGDVTSLVLGGRQDALFAGVFDGIMKSIDGGRTWHYALTDTLASWPFYLAVDPADPETIYAGWREGVYKTSDGGATWNWLNLAIRNVGAVAISPAAPNTIWVGGNGLFVSRDAGASWSSAQGGLPAPLPGNTFETRSVVVDPTLAGVVYASISRAGLFKTVDYGAHWTRVLAEAPRALAIDPIHPWKIYAGGDVRGGLLRSTDGGATWTSVFASDALVLAVDPVTSAVYAAVAISSPHGFYRSLDSGETWTDIGSSLPTMLPYDFAFDPRHPAIVYVGSSSGVWKSVNRGRSWVPSSSGITAMALTLAVDPSDARIVYAGGESGELFKSVNRGETWTTLTPKGLTNYDISQLKIDPATPSTLFANAGAGLYQSLDRGETWHRLGFTDPVRDVALDYVYDVAIDPANSSTLYVATAYGAFRSVDGGKTWSSVWSPQGPDPFNWVYHVAVSPARPSDVYLTSTSGLFASFDRGDTWTQLPYPNGKTIGLTVDPVHPSTLYVSNQVSLSKSTDGGLTWMRADSGLTLAGSGFPTSDTVTVFIDPVRPQIVYCITWSGVFQSTDGAATWRQLGRSFEDTGVTDLALALDRSETTTLHLGTYTGVFELTQIPPPPPGDFLTADAFPGFRFKVRITEPGQPGVAGRQEINCVPHALCVSGKVRHRTDVLLRVDGPLPDGSFSVTVARLTHAQVEVWAERPATGDKRYYRLEAVPADRSDPAALTGKFAFPGS